MVDDGWWWLMMVDDGWWWLMMVDDGWWWLMMVDDGWRWLMMFWLCVMMFDDFWWCLDDKLALVKKWSSTISEGFWAISLMCVRFILMPFDEFRLFWCFWGVLLEYERKISTQKWVVTWTYHKVATENAAHDAKNHGILGSMVCNSQAPEPTCGQHYNTIGLYLQMIRHVYAYIYIHICVCVTITQHEDAGGLPHGSTFLARIDQNGVGPTQTYVINTWTW